MKKQMAILGVLVLVGMALAATSNSPHGRQDTPPWIEKACWQYDDSLGRWIPIRVGDSSARARCWMQQVDYVDSCNKKEWEIYLRAEASVAQWIILGINGDGFHWGIRKPGYYASDCIWLWFRSNYDVEISFDDFDNLVTLYPDSCIDDTIEVWYALSEDSTAPPAMNSELWKTPAELSEWTRLIRDSYDLHWRGWRTKIWQKIYVSPCNSACEYVDEDWATITLTLQRIKPWIDPETGLFSRRPNFPFQ
ncbi:MAG: hypothetical protein JSU73_10135 [candidate division WOR-3 bacterium]|nr:MAG: hypothetical protein JSU73_10135 [candidate division WOR-3 bacterium]